MVIQFDSSARVYEVFTDAGDWIGAYDTMTEAREAAALAEAA